MGKVIRLVVAGGPETGKTAMLERLIHNNYHPDKKFYSTKEDIYLANIQIRGRAETLRIHDTSGTEKFQRCKTPVSDGRKLTTWYRLNCTNVFNIT